MTGPERMAHLRRLARELVDLRVAATLSQLLPGVVLHLINGPRTRIVASGPAADLRPCQLRRLVATSLAQSSVDDLVAALGGEPQDVAYHLMTCGTVTDRGGGVYEIEQPASRQLILATTLAPAHVTDLVRERGRCRDVPVADRQDSLTGVSVVGLEHRDEVHRNEYRTHMIDLAAACYVAEMADGLPGG